MGVVVLAEGFCEALVIGSQVVGGEEFDDRGLGGSEDEIG